jgi:hypothetical protein
VLGLLLEQVDQTVEDIVERRRDSEPFQQLTGGREQPPGRSDGRRCRRRDKRRDVDQRSLPAVVRLTG